MTRCLSSLARGLCFPFLAFTLPTAVLADARVSESYGKLPLHFEENRGQAHDDVRFLSRGLGYSLYLTAGEAVLVLTQPKAATKGEAWEKEQEKSAALRMRLVGAARKPVLSGTDELPGKANYFVGNDPAKWRTNLPLYGKIHYREVYPGIDLVYYGNQRSLEYDFIVAPGADPGRIALAFEGADRLEIDAQGDLVVHTAGGSLRQHKPVVYQQVDGARQEIAGGYVFTGKNRIGFEVAAYDASLPLVIDPVLSYSTYLGGAASDVSRAIAVDLGGYAYVAGETGSFNFPGTSGAPNGNDAFVTKLDRSGSALVYSTFIGGNSGEVGTGIAVNFRGEAYLTGVTSSRDFPTTAGAFQPSFAGTGFNDAFVVKLDRSGSALAYSTYLGGDSIDNGMGIAVDWRGHAYVTGITSSVNFPVTPGAFQTIHRGGFFDGFVTKLNLDGTGIVYSTFLGGSSSDQALAIAVDFLGSPHVAGTTFSADFPAVGAVQGTLGGFSDAFVTKLDPSGSSLVYSTYLGGAAEERSAGIALDLRGNVYVTGLTNSTNFPVLNAFQAAHGGGVDIFGTVFFDAFVTKLDASGAAMIYSTYLGGNGDDRSGGIAVDLRGNAHVAGTTTSPNFPTINALQGALAGGPTDRGDVFVTKFNRNGSALVYSTYLGGTGNDQGWSIAVDVLGNAYMAGSTSSTDFPTANAFQGNAGGSGASDGFVTKILD